MLNRHQTRNFYLKSSLLTITGLTAYNIDIGFDKKTDDTWPIKSLIEWIGREEMRSAAVKEKSEIITEAFSLFSMKRLRTAFSSLRSAMSGHMPNTNNLAQRR